MFIEVYKGKKEKYMNYIYIDSQDEKTSVAIVENKELVEYFIEQKDQKKILGNIYRARVQNVLKGMQAAFVNIGEGKNAYLYLTDALSEKQKHSGKKHSIENILKTGDEIIVQVIKEPLGDKGAKVSVNLSLTGRYIVLTPFQSGINISRKIKDRNEINRLEDIGENFKNDGVGLIFRTSAKGSQKDVILEEYKNLFKIYQKIESERTFLPTPKLLFSEMSLAYRIIRDNFKEKDYNIVVNKENIYQELLELGESLNIPIKEKLKLDKAFDFKYNTIIQKGLKTALSRTVKLESGASIVIDKTEALTAIDVNTHQYVGSSSLQSTVINTNIEAAKEIAKQLRLRNIGGIVIIDFIDMKPDSDKNKLIKELENSFLKDKNKPYIVDITKLGLVEVTRKRERKDLKSEILFKCPTCEGPGLVKKEFVSSTSENV